MARLYCQNSTLQIEHYTSYLNTILSAHTVQIEQVLSFSAKKSTLI